MHSCFRALAGLLAYVLVLAVAGQVKAQSEDLTRNYQRGSSLFEAGMYKASTPYFVKALELAETEYGRDSSRTAFILKNLATVYSKQGKFEEAEPLYLRAMRVFEEAFGPDHGLVAEVTNELSIVYVERKRFIEAEPLLGRVLENLERSFGANDSRVAVAAYNYGYASEFVGDSNKARSLYARALQIWQSQRVPDDARIQAAQERLAGLSRVRESKGPSLAPYLPKVLPGQDAEAPQVTPAKPPSPRVAKAPVATPSVRVAKAPVVTPPPLGWRVQLASFRSRAAAEKERKRLQEKLASSFGATGGLKIAEAVLSKGTFFRLILTPFEDRAAAAAVCRDLKEKSQPCIVARQN